MKLPEKIRFDHVVGLEIRRRRQECKMSIDDAADASQGRVSKSTLANVEDGRGCSSFVLAVCAEVFDCTIDDLAPIDAMNLKVTA